MQQAGNYTLGLDIGIASVGWCALGETRIVDLGVRIFDKAETADGESLSAQRRQARLLRRRLRRRAWRLLKVARLLKRHGVIADVNLFLRQTPVRKSLWQLRAQGLDQRLLDEDWARVIYHLCKHRGFWFARRAEAEGSEGGKVKQGLDRTRKLMQEKNYRSAAEMALAEFPDNQRNKRGDYSQSLGRDLLAEELAMLFARQRDLGNPFTSPELETALLDQEAGLFWQQKPALSGEAMLKLIGHCTFEKAEYRAAKHSYSAERFVWLTRLNNLRVSIGGESRPLNEVERSLALDLPYELSSVKYKQLKAKLVKAGLWTDDARFGGLNYRDDGKDPEDAKLIELSGWHTLRKTLESAGLKTEWQGLANQPTQLDAIATILSVHKTDAEITQQLARIGLSASVIDALLRVNFSDFIRLSLKALGNILPGMQQGQRYDQACLTAGYHHSQLPVPGKQRLLPKLYVRHEGKIQKNAELDLPNSPVVLRALNQARKVVNAVIQTYGPPMAVHIEMARDLSRPLDERQRVERAQQDFAARNEHDRLRFVEHFGRRPSGREFEKWQLYREQDSKCAYSLRGLDLNLLISDPSYAEVDHALPYSRSFDDSKNNKVLVLAAENRNKGNRTPFEYLDGASNSPRWQAFEAYVRSNHKYRQAKRDRLLRKHFDAKEADEFKERNLNDTRHACRFFKTFVEQHLQLHSDSGAKRCVVVTGQLTSLLRARWGLTKMREASDRHHAIDAGVVAACSHGLVKRMADYARRKELENVRQDFVDAETGEITDVVALRRLEQHFPRPWPHFEHELCLRAGLDRDTGAVRTDLTPDVIGVQLAQWGYSPQTLARVRPLFVSRAPKRLNRGAAHKDTIYAARPTAELPQRVTQKIVLTSLTLKHFGGDEYNPAACSLLEPHRNDALYRALHARLREYGGKAEKAFAADKPFFKPAKQGQGPLVRSVTLVTDKLSGISIRGGIAKNDSMIRVDVFRCPKGKFHLVPVYVHHRVAKELPNRAIVAFKDEDEWTLMDEGHAFLFSLCPNDLVLIKRKGEPDIFGYYRSTHSGTAAFNIALPDRNREDPRTTGYKLWAKDKNKPVPNDKLGLIEGVGIKTAVSVEKYHVDELGRVYRAQSEVRRGLA